MIYICLILINNTFTMGNSNSTSTSVVDFPQNKRVSNVQQPLQYDNYSKTAYATNEERIKGLHCVSMAIADFYKNKENKYSNKVYLFLTKQVDYDTTKQITIQLVSICDEHNAQLLISRDTRDTSDTTYKTEDTQELCSVVAQGLLSLMKKFDNIFSVYEGSVKYNLIVYINKDNTNKITIGPRGCLERIIS